MSEIAVLVPVLNRPRSAEPLVRSLARSGADATIYFVCSPDDEREISACLETGEEVIVVPWRPGRGDWAMKINRAFDLTDEPFCLLGADDLRFHPGWDREALAVAERTGAGVVGTNDLGNPYVMRGHLATHALVRRSYIDEHGTIDEPGKVLHEGYWHNWVDAELTETAMARGEFAFARRSHVEHMHPSWKKAEMDSTYERALDSVRFRADRELLNQRRPLWGHVRRPARTVGRARR